MNRLILVTLCVAILAINAGPLRQEIFGKNTDFVSDVGGFHLVNEGLVLSADPSEKALIFAKLRALPIMKKSNAFGRFGFRPGKRAVAIYAA